MSNPIRLDEAINYLKCFAETFDPERAHGAVPKVPGGFSLKEAADKAQLSYSSMRDFIAVNCSTVPVHVVVRGETKQVEFLDPGRFMERYPLYGGDRERPGPARQTPGTRSTKPE